MGLLHIGGLDGHGHLIVQAPQDGVSFDGSKLLKF